MYAQCAPVDLVFSFILRTEPIVFGGGEYVWYLVYLYRVDTFHQNAREQTSSILRQFAH